MRLPRDVSGADLAKALQRAGYEIDHQTGSHIRLSRRADGEHHITVPNHDPIKVGTFSAILKAVAGHLKLSRDEVVRLLFP